MMESSLKTKVRSIKTPTTDEVAIVRDVAGPYGPLLDQYAGITLRVGPIRTQDAATLYRILHCVDNEDVRREAAEGDREFPTWVRDDKEEAALRLLVAKIKTIQHTPLLRRALERTRSRTIIIAGPRPQGMERTAGTWRGEGNAGRRWEAIREQLERRGARPISATRVPDPICEMVTIDGEQIVRIDRNGDVVA